MPHTLYTDNDAIIKFGRNQRTTAILNKVLLDQGGYQNTFHLPGNARATGKVERLHQTVEQCEKFIRAMFMPAAINFGKTSGDSDDGPIVATIFVFIFENLKRSI